MPKVFVTGGAGYVGAHCCKALATAGWDVTVYDNLCRGWRDFVKWGPLVEGDILDEVRLISALSEFRPDAVMHFAAVAYVGESMTDPATYYRNNTAGALSLLSAMRRASVDKLIFSSTCATYGTPVKVPIDESHPQVPINPYGWSKLFVEQMLRDHDMAYGLRSVSLRYFNAAGADPEGEIGERHEPETHVVPLILRGARDPGYVFTIHGSDYETLDGTAVRDYVHVADLADAHLRALVYLMEDGRTDAFNLGTGRGISVKELVQAVEGQTGTSIRCEAGPRRPGDPAVLVADASKAGRCLGWQPRYREIAEIVHHADAWAAADSYPGA